MSICTLVLSSLWKSNRKHNRYEFWPHGGRNQTLNTQMNTEVKKIRFHKGRAWQPKSEEGDRKRRSNLCTEDATGRKQRSGGQVWEMAESRPDTACSLEEKEKEVMAETRTSAWETHLDLQLQQAPHLFCPQFPTHSVTVLRSRVSCLQSITTGAAPKPHPFESGSPPCSNDHSPHPCLTPQYQPGISQKASLGERQTSYLLESCSRILDLET